MKFLLGFLSGLAAAWAALAIWQRVPSLGPIDAADEDGSLDHLMTEGARRIPSAVAVHHHDRFCRYPDWPCVCAILPARREP